MICSGSRQPQGPPLDAKGSPEGDHQERQEQRVLQHAGIPRREHAARSWRVRCPCACRTRTARSTASRTARTGPRSQRIAGGSSRPHGIATMPLRSLSWSGSLAQSGPVCGARRRSGDECVVLAGRARVRPRRPGPGSRVSHSPRHQPTPRRTPMTTPNSIRPASSPGRPYDC